MITTIADLKKGDTFEFNCTIFEVKQSYKDWKRNDEPYLVTSCGNLYYYGGLEVILR